MSELTERLKEEFKDKETRHIYAEDFLNTLIATQLKVLREDRDWTQAKVAEEAGMRQERISVLEDVNYDSWSVKTLKRLAKAFDLRLSIKFETFGSFLRDFEAFNHESLSRVSFDKDPIFAGESALSLADSTGQGVNIEAGTQTGIIERQPSRKPFVKSFQSASSLAVNIQQEDSWPKIAIRS